MGLKSFLQNYYMALRCNHFGKERILKIQKQRFRRLLHHAVNHSEFYQELYRGIDIENCGLQDLPVVTKSAMMNNFDRFMTDSRLKLHELQEWIADNKNDTKLYLGEFLPIPSSGSTGIYALVVYHRRALDLVQASLFARHPLHAKRSLYYHAKMLMTQLLGTKARIAAIGIPRGHLIPFVRSAPPIHRFIAKLKILSVSDPIEQIVAALNEFQPDSLISNSLFLPILAQEQLAGNLDIAFNRPFSYLAGFGEPLTEHTKGLARKAWNIGIQNDYGAAECYFMATSCQESGHLHAMNDLCILEVVDGANNPVPQGQYGEKILVTNLANFTQPIIRYEIEDIVGYDSQCCKCGLPFPTLLPMHGRQSEFIYFEKPQGGYERIPPNRLIIPLWYAHELRQYQIVQTARNELVFYYVPQKDDADLEQKLRKTLEEALGQDGIESRVTLKLKRVEVIPRDDRSGKFQIIKSLEAPSALNRELEPNS